MTACAAAQTGLDLRKEELRALVERNEKFIKDTRNTIEKAERKAKEHDEASLQLDVDIQGLQRELSDLQARLQLKSQSAAAHDRHKDYLISSIRF